MKPSKVLIVVTSEAVAGTGQRACAQLANVLVASGSYEVVLMSIGGGLESAVPIHRKVMLDELFPAVPNLLMAAPAVLSAMRVALRRHLPDVVVVVDSLLSMFVLPAATGLGCRIVNWERQHADASLGSPLRVLARRMAVRWSDRMVVQTREDQMRWYEKYAIPAAKVTVVPDINPFHARIHLPTNVRSRTVLAVGRYVSHNGFHLLLDAWARMPPGARRGWKLRIVGDGPERHALEAQARRLRISPVVELAGWNHQMHHEYRHAGLIALTSHADGGSARLVEAASHGVPAIAFDCACGPRDFIEDGVTGRLVRAGDVEELASTLRALIASPDTRRSLGEAAAKSVARFTPAAVFEQWQPVLQALAQPPVCDGGRQCVGLVNSSMRI